MLSSIHPLSCRPPRIFGGRTPDLLLHCAWGLRIGVRYWPHWHLSPCPQGRRTRRGPSFRCACQSSTTVRWNSSTTDSSPSTRIRLLADSKAITNAIGYGLTPWWEIELEGESNSVPDSSVHYTATTVENTFQLTQPGKYAFNLGFFAEYSQSALRNEPNSFTVGPIVQKELYNVLGIDSVHTFNVFLAHDVGHNASHATGLELAWQSRLYLTPYIDPAIEYYGFIDDLANAGPFGKQQHFLGPVAVGAVNFAPYGKVEYEVGYMFGLTQASPRGAIRWKLEYEIAF